MMCQRIGLPPISTIGFGRTAVSSLSREPNPPARMTAFTGLKPSDGRTDGRGRTHTAPLRSPHSEHAASLDPHANRRILQLQVLHNRPIRSLEEKACRGYRNQATANGTSGRCMRVVRRFAGQAIVALPHLKPAKPGREEWVCDADPPGLGGIGEEVTIPQERADGRWRGAFCGGITTGGVGR